MRACSIRAFVPLEKRLPETHGTSAELPALSAGGRGSESAAAIARLCTSRQSPASVGRTGSRARDHGPPTACFCRFAVEALAFIAAIGNPTFAFALNELFRDATFTSLAPAPSGSLDFPRESIRARGDDSDSDAARPAGRRCCAGGRGVRPPRSADRVGAASCAPRAFPLPSLPNAVPSPNLQVLFDDERPVCVRTEVMADSSAAGSSLILALSGRMDERTLRCGAARLRRLGGFRGGRRERSTTGAGRVALLQARPGAPRKTPLAAPSSTDCSVTTALVTG